MTFASDSDLTGGKTIVTLVSLTDGVTTYRWSTGGTDVFDDTANVWYTPLIVDIGSIDRVMDVGAPRESDLQLSLSNADGSLDALFSDFSSFSPINATATIKIGFSTQSVSAFKTIATMTFARVVGVSQDRVITLELVENLDRALGEIKPYTSQEVYDALTVADNTTYPARVDIINGERPVPVVLGRYKLNDTLDGVTAGHSFASGTALDGQTFNGIVRMAAIGRYAFETTRMRAIPIDTDGNVRVATNGIVGGLWSAATFTSSFALIAWEDVTVTLGGLSWHVLVVKIKNNIADTSGIGAHGTWRFSCEPFAPQRIEVSDWRAAECVRGAVESAENFTSWAAKADSTSWDTVNAHTGTRMRRIIYETTRTSEVINDFLTQAQIDSYMTADGKLAGFWLVGTPGGTPDYSGSFQVTEADDVLSMDAELQTSGRWSVANSITAQYSPIGDIFSPFIAEFARLPQGARDVITGLAAESTVLEDATSISNHGRRYSESVGGDLLYVLADSEALARRELALRADPRWLVPAAVPWRGAQVELGDIVELSHTAMPGWSANRACVVYAISYGVGDHRAILSLIDFDTYLRFKTCLYDTMADWVVSDNADESLTVAVVNGSSVITYSANGNWEEAEVGDIVELRSATNQWQGTILSEDSGAKTHTLDNTGGETGIQNTGYANEAAATAWKILRSQSNRDTASSNYDAQDAKYGCYAVGADGFFIDDSTAAYTFQR